MNIQDLTLLLPLTTDVDVDDSLQYLSLIRPHEQGEELLGFGLF